MRTNTIFCVAALLSLGACETTESALPKANSSGDFFFTILKQLNEGNAPNFSFSGEAYYPGKKNTNIDEAEFLMRATITGGTSVVVEKQVDVKAPNTWKQIIQGFLPDIQSIDSRYKKVITPESCPIKNFRDEQAWITPLPDENGNYEITVAFGFELENPTDVIYVAPVVKYPNTNDAQLLGRVTHDLNTNGTPVEDSNFSFNQDRAYDTITIVCGSYENEVLPIPISTKPS